MILTRILAVPLAALAFSVTAARSAGAQATPPVAAPSTAPAPGPVTAVDQAFALHGQATFVEQYHPAFTSAYRGPNSLDPGSRGAETVDVTVFAGLRLWRGAELWANAEVDQGFGLSNTLGVAAFPSSESYKVGASLPYARLPRLFVRQEIDLGGAADPQTAAANQLSTQRTANRVVLTGGKFGVVDVFDTNAFAHDGRADFLNWAVVDAGAFDYTADAWGYTYGAAAEWYQSWWTLRAGVFDGSTYPNSALLDRRPFQQTQLDVEAEARYALWGKAGAVRVLGFGTRALLGSFADLLAYAAAHPGATAAQTESVRHLRNKFGASLNIEQHVTADLGAFVRASFDDGRTEVYEFTDIDRSLSSGLSLSGRAWGRADDTVGAAVVLNNITKARKDYFEQGGLGVLIGDGRLVHAGPEQVLETYYAYAWRPGVQLTGDYQLVRNPAYNRDRGPVGVLGVRMHVQF